MIRNMLVGAALCLFALETIPNANAAAGGINHNCQQVSDVIFRYIEQCKRYAREAAPEDRQRHWDFCQSQVGKANAFVERCNNSYPQCQERGRSGLVSWHFGVASRPGQSWGGWDLSCSP